MSKRMLCYYTPLIYSFLVATACWMLIWRDLLVLWPCRCAYVDFDVAVFTNILQEKVDAFGGIAPYLEAQGSLFLKLKDPNRQRAVVNSDGMCLLV